MIESVLRRVCIVTDAAEFEKRRGALDGRLAPYLRQQPGFVSHELRHDQATTPGAMIHTTAWRTDADVRTYLRGGAAAMVATWLDGYFPTAPFPNGNWVRENIERADAPA
jgi:hypothetical protein